MTWFAILLGICVLISARGISASDAPEIVALENQVLRREIRTTPAPYVDQLVHRASGRALVTGAAHQSLFSIILTNEEGGQETIDSARAGESSVGVETTGGVSKVTITYRKFPRLDLTAVVTVVSDERSALTLWSLQVKNNTYQRIEAIRFPQLLGVPTIGDVRVANACGEGGRFNGSPYDKQIAELPSAGSLPRIGNWAIPMKI